MPDDAVYRSWKTLRNFLRKMGKADSLEAIWYYSWFVYQSLPLPDNLSKPVNMSVYSKVINPSNLYLFTWELSLLAMEVALNSRDYSLNAEESLKDKNNFVSALNKLKKLNEAATDAVAKSSNVLDELYRIEHQQFRYQGHFRDLVPVIRYFKIYNSPEMAKIFLSRLGIDCKKFFSAGLMLRWLFMQSAQISWPIKIDGISESLNEGIATVVNMIAMDAGEIQQVIEKSHVADGDYQYRFNPLVAKPLIIFHGEKMVCPIPDNLNKRLLDSVYYDLCDDKKFDDGYNFGGALGNSFQNYIGDLLIKTLGKEHIFSEDTDAENENLKRCDWVIGQGDSCVLVECKTKRPAQEAYTVIGDLKQLDAQLDILAGAVLQTYEAYLNYKDGRYKSPQYTFKGGTKTAICVVTMEPWYLVGKQKRKLDTMIRRKLNVAGFRPELIEEVPYIIMSVEELENFSYFLTRYDGFDLINKYYSEVPEDAVTSIVNFIEDKEFLKRYRYVFENDLRVCYSQEIIDIL